MSTIRFTKHHGLGNDFIVVCGPVGPDPAELARRWCNRRRGIGADGLLIIHEAPGYRARMELLNADGSSAAMSGNGIRCFVQALALESGEYGEYLILTDAGDRLVDVYPTADADTIGATVSMGVVTEIDAPAGWSAIGADPGRPVAHLSLGNPHTVVGVSDVDEVDLVALGAQLCDVNLEIVQPGTDPASITMRVHERGVGVTEACGTGACAAAAAARRWGLVPASAAAVEVTMPGGVARVSFEGDEVYLTGPATLVASGEVRL